MKTINVVNKMVATNLNLDLKTVEKVNKAYWREIVKNFTTVGEQAVHIKRIGTIEASAYKTRAYIFYLIKKIRKIQQSPKYTEETKARVVETIKESIRTLLKKRNQLAIEYYNKANELKNKGILKSNPASMGK